ncbi:zinc-binding dehydrogenase [Nitrospira defluvii]|nr:zinc-binding dehydrogenase [Nitrospira defluvii]
MGTSVIQESNKTNSNEKQARTNQMKAAVIHQFGDYDAFSYEDIQKPSPKPGHVLIKILAAGVNRFDHYIREGSVFPGLPFPHILGADAVGEVAELGAGVTGFEIGDRVVPVGNYPSDEKDYDFTPLGAAPSIGVIGLHYPGTYAQYMVVPTHWLFKDESGLKPEELATLPMVMFTGVRAVKVLGEVKTGDKVLIHTGASGTGSLAIQIAKVLGAEIATTIREDAKRDYVNKLGADLIINTRHEDFVEKVKQWTGGRGADVVIDNLGGDVLPKSIDAVKALGIVVVLGFVAGTQVTFDIRNFFFGQKQLRGSMFGDVADYQWGMEQVRAGRIKPLLDRALPLSQAAEAHRLISTNQVAGNIVLLPWAE